MMNKRGNVALDDLLHGIWNGDVLCGVFHGENGRGQGSQSSSVAERENTFN